MYEIRCLVNKTYKKIAYPISTIVEPLHCNNFSPLKLITHELRSGETLIVEFHNDQPCRIFVVDDSSLLQIYGSTIDKSGTHKTKCLYHHKKQKIKRYVFELLEKIRLNDLITHKNDLEDFENEITKYLLLCKSKEKLDCKKLRSIAFKNCKNIKLAEKLSTDMKYNMFCDFENLTTDVIIDWDSLTVQFES